MPGIHSERVVLLEGNVAEIVPNAKLAADMHGFVIMVPLGDEGEKLLDMLWRITIAYAGRPSLLRSHTTVRKMIEAVWGKERRDDQPAHHPARKRGKADRTHGEESPLPSTLSRLKPSLTRSEGEGGDMEIAQRVMKENRKALRELSDFGDGITADKARDGKGVGSKKANASRHPVKSGKKARTRG